jgi:hypothetical protein
MGEEDLHAEFWCRNLLYLSNWPKRRWHGNIYILGREDVWTQDGRNWLRIVSIKGVKSSREKVKVDDKTQNASERPSLRIRIWKYLLTYRDFALLESQIISVLIHFTNSISFLWRYSPNLGLGLPQ